jgi:hypothetical protein
MFFIYLARYTHRVAISNHRLVNVAGGKVTFRWKDYARGSRQRTMTVSGEEFLRRFMLHVLPRGFVRIRFFGFLANRHRASLLPVCQQLLETSPSQNLRTSTARETRLPASWLCPHCGGAMVLIEKLTALQICCRATEGSTSLTLRNQHYSSTRLCAPALALKVCPLMRKCEKQATIPTAVNSKMRFSQASSLRQTKLATLLVTNHVLLQSRNSIQHP